MGVGIEECGDGLQMRLGGLRGFWGIGSESSLFDSHWVVVCVSCGLVFCAAGRDFAAGWISAAAGVGAVGISDGVWWP
jgi:hypothetical protein